MRNSRGKDLSAPRTAAREDFSIPSRRISAVPVALVLSLILALLPSRAQAPDPVFTWQSLINQARLDEGLAPYGFSSLLTAAAQRHADDLAANQMTSHTGSDGSTAAERIAETGYAAWRWNGGALIVGENFWVGQGAIEDALAFFLEDPAHRDNILSPTYREIGIGFATDADGRNYHVIDFGARPNVLPIFINDGAVSAGDAQVAIRLTNEEARPGGEGVVFMGRAIEIRISNEPDFENMPWQPWEPLVPWTLPDTPGEHTVYVQFRDAAGRTAASPDTIILGDDVSVTPTPVPSSPMPEPTATPVPPTPTLEPTLTAVPTSPPPTPSLEGSTGIPPATSESTAVSDAEPTATVFPSLTPVLAEPLPVRVTPFPTWTPLPTPTPQEEARRPDAPLSLLLALQGLALIFGIYLALHRGRGR